MFESDEEEEIDSFEDEYYDWRNAYEFSFPAELLDNYENHVYDFYKTKYSVIITEFIPAMRELMYCHYPEMETELRPLIVEIIEQRLESLCIKTLIDLFVLFHYEQSGINLKDKYPDLDKWTTLFSTPIVPYRNMNETFEKLNLTREQRRGIMAELEKDDDFVTRKERRRGDFINVVQKVVFKHYPFLDRLNGEGWIVFSALMHGQFFEYKFHFDYIGTFIVLKLPEEDIHLTYGELQKKFDALYMEKS